MPHAPGLLRVTPKELNFPPPLNRVITNILKLHNVSGEFSIAYKVKTTAPQRYCVRPNSGVLPPGETIEVQVLLNYVKDTPTSLECKDKFQIQSVLLKEPYGDIKEVWAKVSEDQIMKQKLKARFTQPAATKPHDVDSEKDSPLLPSHAQTSGEVAEPPHSQQIKMEDSPPQQYFTLSHPTQEISPPIANVSERQEDSPKYAMPSDEHPTESLNSGSHTLIDAHVSLRKALDQVVTISSDRDLLAKQNNAFIDQIKLLSEQIIQLQHEQQQQQQQQQHKVVDPHISEVTGLHYRGQSKMNPGEAISSGKLGAATPQPTPLNSKPMLVLLLLVALLGFLLGKSYA